MNKKINEKMHKKSQGLSLQTIVVAVLVLMVMIVLMVIFSNKTGPVADMYSKCAGPEIGGTFIDVDKSCDETGKPYVHPLYKEKDSSGKVIKKCCVENFV